MNSNYPQDDTLSLLKTGKLQGSTRLKLQCGLTEFPAEIFSLADTLEILDLSGNVLSALPDDIDKLHKLRILFCSSNQFTHLPEALGKCHSLSMIGFKANQISHIAENAIPTQALRWLILTDNALSRLPDAIGDCQHMQKLMLAGNRLKELPETLANCKKLELLRISANQLQSLPEWLFSLPKLSWLAYAGNPFSDVIENKLIAKQAITHIDWASLQLQRQLGEGASGLIYKALWQKDALTNKAIAVKMFKADLTSDGLPRCEVHATALAGQHPNLLGLKGVISQHPEDKQGMVMPLMDADLTVLADPPSFESCSRDVYPASAKFGLKNVLSITHSIASVVSHLHAQGITHGDLYAHNILSNSNDEVILSDFGGASFLPIDNLAQSLSLQAIESHAFGCLLEELLTRCDADNMTTQALWAIQAECVQANYAKRPLFNAIEDKLNRLKQAYSAQSTISV